MGPLRREQCKKEFCGTYHKIKKNTCSYTSMIFYKLDRRYFVDLIFDRLIIAYLTASGR